MHLKITVCVIAGISSSSESEVACVLGFGSGVQLLLCGIGDGDVLGLLSSQLHCHNTNTLSSLKKV